MAMEKIIQHCVFPAIQEIGTQISRKGELRAAVDAPLFTASGPLDSLELVRLILLVEDNVLKEFKIPIRLASLRAANYGTTPFLRVDTLAAFIAELLTEAESQKR
jgi:hypothetical protein